MFILETIFMFLAVAIAFFDGGNGLTPLLLSSAIMLGCGLLCYGIGFKANEFNVGRREGMLIVTLTWIFVSLLGMLPFYLGGYVPSITDAFFETMSGFTTTGSSILTNVEALPNSILFWRSLTQWQGGMGMIVFTVALLPALGGGAIMMFDAETPGIIHERFLPPNCTGCQAFMVYLCIPHHCINTPSLGGADESFRCCQSGDDNDVDRRLLYKKLQYCLLEFALYRLCNHDIHVCRCNQHEFDILSLQR